MQKIVVFDMDGTLIDSKKDITISVNYVRNFHYNLPSLSEEYIVEVINMEVRNLPKLFYETDIYETKARLTFEEHYATQCTQNPYLYEGIRYTLSSLKDAGVKMSVATNAPTIFASTMLSHLGVAEMFDVIMGADRVSESKPNPEMLYKILDFYNYNKNKDSAWMIGDNSKDMLCAKNAGIEALFATWGFTSQGVHDVILKDPTEVLGIVL